MEAQRKPLVSEEEKKLSVNEKLDLLDREVRLLYEFCKNSGFKPGEIEKAAAPFLNTTKRVSRRRWRKRAIDAGKIATLFAILGFALFYIDPVYRGMCFFARRTTIKMLPYWDWTNLYDQPCLIENPYYEGNQITEEDCMACESMNSIPVEENITHSVMSELYLKGLSPVIVTDAMKDWPERKNMNIGYLTELYTTHEVVKEYMSCDYLSNIRVKFGNHRVLLRKIVAGEVSTYFAHWENCFKEAARVFREVFPRPYFLPPMVEQTDTNFIFISSGFNAKSYKPIDTWSSMLTFAQIKGQNKVKVTPKMPCDKMCEAFEDTLDEGEILVVPYFLWNFSYLPVGGEENIAFGVGGNFD
ncbi:uncharacterized protein LOC135476171 [Liolophura sinensis]|uniref:uncharacterized protein LOC135476171 n=1 Tax=Liolophura sinensis TaxID=3198878 RepID=UPI003159438C